jgi:hypothetical protein
VPNNEKKGKLPQIKAGSADILKNTILSTDIQVNMLITLNDHMVVSARKIVI